MLQRRKTRRHDVEVARQKPAPAHRQLWYASAVLLVVLTVGTATAVYSLLPVQPLFDVGASGADVAKRQRDARGAEPRASDHQVLVDRPNDPDALYNLGLALQSQGKLTEAIREYRQALEINDDHADAHNNLAAALAVSGELDEAIDHFRRVVALRPDYAQGHFNLGTALTAQSKLDEAIHCYRRAIELKSDYAKAHNDLAVVLKRTGHREEAYQHMQEALRLKRAAAQP